MEFIERWLEISSNAVTVIGVFLSLISLIVTLSTKRTGVKAVAAVFLLLIVGTLTLSYLLAANSTGGPAPVALPLDGEASAPREEPEEERAQEPSQPEPRESLQETPAPAPPDTDEGAASRLADSGPGASPDGADGDSGEEAAEESAPAPAGPVVLDVTGLDAFVYGFHYDHSPRGDGLAGGDSFVARWTRWSAANRSLRGEGYPRAVDTGYYLSVLHIPTMYGYATAQATVELHLTLRAGDNLDNCVWEGEIVVAGEYPGNEATGHVAILLDGAQAWSTAQPVTGSDLDTTKFSVDLTGCESTITVLVSCYPRGDGFKIGIV